MSVERLPNWEVLASTYLSQVKSKPFCWGEFDCCLFAADFVLAITGVDYAAEFRGRYTTELGAARVLKKSGAGNVKTTLNGMLTPVKSRLNIHRGDVVMVEHDGLTPLGIKFNGVWCVSEGGLVRVSPKSIITGWRVGACQ